MWRFPGRRPRLTQVIDAEDLNEGFLPLVAASGHLGEGNVRDLLAGQVDAVAEVASDVAYRDHFAANTVYAGGPVDDAIAGGGTARVQIGNGWTRVGVLLLEHDVEAGPVLLMASFQHGRRRPNNGNNEPERHAYVNVQYGFRMDGNVLSLSVVGDQDSGHEGDGMEKGIWNHLQGVDLFFIVDCGPGRHAFEVVCHAESDIVSEEDIVDDTDLDDYVVVYSREFVAIEVK
jgi:hypothetical protein